MDDNDTKSDAALTEGNGTPADAGDGVSTEVKKLQRELNKARTREREAVLRLLAEQEATERLERIESTVVDLADVLGMGGLLEDGDGPVKAFKDKVEKRKVAVTGGSAARKQFTNLLLEKGADWNDERLAGARAAWTAGDLAGAITQATAALSKDGAASDDFEARVQAELDKRLKKAGRVDTGDSTASGGIPTDPKVLKEKIRSDPEWYRKHRDEIFDAARKGRIPLK